MYKGMERGIDIIEDEVSTRDAIETLFKAAKSGALDIETEESGGAALNID